VAREGEGCGGEGRGEARRKPPASKRATWRPRSKAIICVAGNTKWSTTRTRAKNNMLVNETERHDTTQETKPEKEGPDKRGQRTTIQHTSSRGPIHRVIFVTCKHGCANTETLGCNYKGECDAG